MQRGTDNSFFGNALIRCCCAPAQRLLFLRSRLETDMFDSRDEIHATYLIEHSHGVCELLLKRDESGEISIYEPQRLTRVSGVGTVLLRAEMIAEAIALEKWMADHFEVFTEGIVSPD